MFRVPTWIGFEEFCTFTAMNATRLMPSMQAEFEWTDDERTWMKRHALAIQGDILPRLKDKPNLRYPLMTHKLMSRQKYKSKFPTWSQTEDVVFPPGLNLEQASSEITAEFKSSLVQGHTFLDLTAGMGMDSFYFAARFEQGVLVEQQSSLAKYTAHNFACLHRSNVTIEAGLSAEQFLQYFSSQIDFVFIDPDRRPGKDRSILLEDCTPNVIELAPRLVNLSKKVMIKCSPLLDIQASIHQLGFVTEVYVVAVNNECKELLLILEKTQTSSPKINAINLNSSHQVSQFSFDWHEEQASQVECGELQNFLYEPNAAIMKSGGFKQLAQQWGVKKLHTHTHLYTSDECMPNFPGRVFKVENSCSVSKKSLTPYLTGLKANLTLRNFPGSQADLKKKLGIQDGGEQYVFACTLVDESHALLVCRKAVFKEIP